MVQLTLATSHVILRWISTRRSKIAQEKLPLKETASTTKAASSKVGQLFRRISKTTAAVSSHSGSHSLAIGAPAKEEESGVALDEEKADDALKMVTNEVETGTEEERHKPPFIY